MTFLAPLWLALAAAVAVPLLIHLLRRRIGTRVDFPAIRYIERAEREHSRSVKLRNFLLMALRVAIVLLVALAAGRPLASWAGGSHAPTAVAIVLDNSLSTSIIVDGRPLLEQLKEAATAVVERASESDRLWLVTADGSVRAGTAAELTGTIAGIEALAGGGDVRAATAAAARLASVAELDAAVVAVVTDGQRTAWDGERIDLGRSGAVLWRPEVAPTRNRAVVEATPRPSRWTPRGELVVRVASPDSVGFRVAMRPLGSREEPRTAARGTASPGSPTVVQMSPESRGWLAGTVEIPTDELSADDTRHFAVWAGPPPAVSTTDGAGPFVRAAIEALRATSRVVEGREVAIGPPNEVSRLPALILAPIDPLRLPEANRALDRLGVPWRLGELRRGGARVAGDRLDDVEVANRYELTRVTAAPGDTLAVAGGRPWIVAGEGFVLVASPLDPDATTLPIRAVFVPWLADVLADYLGDAVNPLVHASPGGRVTIAGATFDAPSAAGVHRVAVEGRDVVVVANADPRESDLARMDAAELAALLSGAEARIAETPELLAHETFRIAGRRPLMEPLLVFGALLLVAEGLVSRTSRRTAA